MPSAPWNRDGRTPLLGASGSSHPSFVVRPWRSGKGQRAWVGPPAAARQVGERMVAASAASVERFIERALKEPAQTTQTAMTSRGNARAEAGDSS